MYYKNHTLLSKKETNRLKNVGGPRSKRSSKKQLLRMQRNIEIIKKAQ